MTPLKNNDLNALLRDSLRRQDIPPAELNQKLLQQLRQKQMSAKSDANDKYALERGGSRKIRMRKGIAIATAAACLVICAAVPIGIQLHGGTPPSTPSVSSKTDDAALQELLRYDPEDGRMRQTKLTEEFLKAAEMTVVLQKTMETVSGGDGKNVKVTDTEARKALTWQSITPANELCPTSFERKQFTNTGKTATASVEEYDDFLRLRELSCDPEADVPILSREIGSDEDAIEAGQDLMTRLVDLYQDDAWKADCTRELEGGDYTVTFTRNILGEVNDTVRMRFSADGLVSAQFDFTNLYETDLIREFYRQDEVREKKWTTELQEVPVEKIYNLLKTTIEQQLNQDLSAQNLLEYNFKYHLALDGTTFYMTCWAWRNGRGGDYFYYNSACAYNSEMVQNDPADTTVDPTAEFLKVEQLTLVGDAKADYVPYLFGTERKTIASLLQEGKLMPIDAGDAIPAQLDAQLYQNAAGTKKAFVRSIGGTLRLLSYENTEPSSPNTDLSRAQRQQKAKEYATALFPEISFDAECTVQNTDEGFLLEQIELSSHEASMAFSTKSLFVNPDGTLKSVTAFDSGLEATDQVTLLQENLYQKVKKYCEEKMNIGYPSLASGFLIGDRVYLVTMLQHHDETVSYYYTSGSLTDAPEKTYETRLAEWLNDNGFSPANSQTLRPNWYGFDMHPLGEEDILNPPLETCSAYTNPDGQTALMANGQLVGFYGTGQKKGSEKTAEEQKQQAKELMALFYKENAEDFSPEPKRVTDGAGYVYYTVTQQQTYPEGQTTYEKSDATLELETDGSIRKFSVNRYIYGADMQNALNTLENEVYQSMKVDYPDCNVEFSDVHFPLINGMLYCYGTVKVLDKTDEHLVESRLVYHMTEDYYAAYE